MAILKISTAYNRTFSLKTSAGAPVTGATATVNLSKNVASFGAAVGAVGEIGNGTYYVALVGSDTNVLGDLAYYITSTGGSGTSLPVSFSDQVQSQIFTDLNLTSSGRVYVVSSMMQNATFSFFPFTMTSTATGNELPGLSGQITAQRALGSGGFAPCANAPVELSNGAYYIVFAASDLNASGGIYLRLTAPGANTIDMQLFPQP